MSKREYPVPTCISSSRVFSIAVAVAVSKGVGVVGVHPVVVRSHVVPDFVYVREIREAIRVYHRVGVRCE